MSVNQEPSGRRSVAVEIEVPGTSEEVWQAIATGPGISSWLMPTEFEVSDGKPVAVKFNFGPGMDVTSPITAWQPPHSWTSQSEGWAPGAPPVANQWSIEARGVGACSVRIAHSLIASTDQWDDQIECPAGAWSAFLHTLQIYLTHFRGARTTVMKLMAPVAGTEAEAWDSLTAALGVTGLNVGHQWTAPADAPACSGVVEYMTQNPYDALIRIDRPGPGIAALGAFNFGGQSMVAMNVYLYGDQAPATAAHETPLWEAWFQEHLPIVAEPGTNE